MTCISGQRGLEETRVIKVSSKRFGGPALIATDLSKKLPVEKIMNTLKKAAIAAAAFSMVASPVAASAAPVALDSARASVQLEDASAQSGGNWALLLLGVATFFAGVATVLSGGSSNNPVSV
jgi:hypothetical protein